MSILSNIIDRLNQRIAAGNIFDKIYPLCELVNEQGGGKAWASYIGNGQLETITNYDARKGTLFWAKRGKVSIRQEERFRYAGCKIVYETRFPLLANAVVQKRHLPCDSWDAEDWIASRVFKLIVGNDPLFKQAIKVIDYKVEPIAYLDTVKSLPDNYEYACVSMEVDVVIYTPSEDACYDICETGDIPLPDFEPCTPCLTSVAVDGETIVGDGTPENPLSAIGFSGSLRVQDEGVTVSNAATTINFTGAGVTATLSSPGNVEVNIPGGGGSGAVNSVNGQTGVVVLDTDDIADTATNRYTNDTDIARLANTSGSNTGDQDLSGLVPYTGATNNVDLGTHTITSRNAVVNHPSGSGVALSVTKGGSGEGLTVQKTSGSGNAASITGGVTLLDELHLNTDLADAYIASAAAWNAKQDALSAGSGISIVSNIVTNTAPDQTVVLTAGAGIGVSGTYPNFTIANNAPASQPLKSQTDGTVSSGVALTVSHVQEVAANFVGAGDTLHVKNFCRMTGTGGAKTGRIYINTTPNLSGSPILVATYASLASALGLAYERHVRFKTTALAEVFPVTVNANTDIIQSGLIANLTVDATAVFYIIFTVQCASGVDTMISSGYTIEKI